MNPVDGMHRRAGRFEYSLALIVVVVLGCVSGLYDIANTSFGWHLASGRIMLEEKRILRTDPLSFTAEGEPWIDHEWLFQIIVAAVDHLGSEPALVLFRALLIAALAGLLFFLGATSGLSPPLAVILSCLCLYGARIRFFLRPELCTLLVVPAVIWLFLGFDGARPPSMRWYGALLTLMIVGINLHGAVLVLIPLVGLIWLGGCLFLVRDRTRLRIYAVHGAAGLATLAVAALVNPFTWRVYTVPITLMRLVGLPQIPNPEWISPGPGDVPSLYVGMAVALLVLIAGERDPRRWILSLITSYLALRYVRNVGLYFALFPVAIGPALARVLGRDLRPILLRAAATAAVCAVGFGMVSESRYRLRFALSPDWYPIRACSFMEEEGLLDGRIYNDVRFGGYLTQREYPPRKVFIDDRNELHVDLLTEIYEIYQRSKPEELATLIRRHGASAALIRYNPPFKVTSPAGEYLGHRGYAALWFPRQLWALVYWDDVAMVFVDRSSADPDLLARHEYALLVPDDFGYLKQRLIAEPDLRPLAAAELARKLAEEPENRRALELGEFLMGLVGGGANQEMWRISQVGEFGLEGKV